MRQLRRCSPLSLASKYALGLRDDAAGAMKVDLPTANGELAGASGPDRAGRLGRGGRSARKTTCSLSVSAPRSMNGLLLVTRRRSSQCAPRPGHAT